MFITVKQALSKATTPPPKDGTPFLALCKDEEGARYWRVCYWATDTDWDGKTKGCFYSDVHELYDSEGDHCELGLCKEQIVRWVPLENVGDSPSRIGAR